MLLWRTPDMPNSSSTLMAFSPLSPSCATPSINAVSAVMGSPFHAAANSCAVIPATCAIFSRSAPPLATNVLIVLSVCVMAVPPASACIPTDDIAADNASICGSDNPASRPADAMRVDISVICDSVVAKLLPSATIVEPSRS